MTGYGHERLPVEAQSALARLLDLRPSLTQPNIKTDSGMLPIARDWPSSRMEESDALLTWIGNVSGIRAVTLAQGQ